MILLRILDHDLHKPRVSTAQGAPIILETPVHRDCLPAVVSSSTPGKFLVVRKLTQDSRIRSGVFSYVPDTLDNLISDLFQSAYDLSLQEKWNNVFGSPKKAFDYIVESSGTTSQPHACLFPISWDENKQKKFFGKDLKEGKYKETCRIIAVNIRIPVFCSRPDYVGLYTQFIGGKSSLILHNIKYGLSFVNSS